MFPRSGSSPQRIVPRENCGLPDCFVLAEHQGTVIGYINGCATNSGVIRDEFFHSADCHIPDGRNLAIFGLAVRPEYQGRGIGVLLMQRFIQQAKDSGRHGIILTCKAALVSYYESFGYVNQGRSQSNHGGAEWFDMRLDFTAEGAEDAARQSRTQNRVSLAASGSAVGRTRSKSD